MGQTPTHDYLAVRFAGWLRQARTCHQLLRNLVESAEEVDTPGDGTVLVRLPYAEWRAACREAASAPPEPLSGPIGPTNDSTPSPGLPG